MVIEASQAAHAPELDYFLSLTDHELRRRREAENGIFIAESSKVVKSALDAGITPLAFLVEDRRLESIASLLAQIDDEVPVFSMPRDQISQLVGYPHNRGVLCAMARPAPHDPRIILNDSSLVAVIEDVTDTTNVGAIFRSAAALGVDAVFITPRCADPLSRRCVRVSMGAVFDIPWARFEDWPEQGIELFHETGFEVLACALSDDSWSLDDPRVHEIERAALLFGTEGDGLKETTIAQADHVVRIPMAHGVDSLNVAAASAVFFWELASKRRHK